MSAHKELVSKIKETRIPDENFNNVLVSTEVMFEVSSAITNLLHKFQVMMRETMNILSSMMEQSHGDELDHISDHIKGCYMSLQGQPASVNDKVVMNTIYISLTLF